MSAGDSSIAVNRIGIDGNRVVPTAENRMDAVNDRPVNLPKTGVQTRALSTSNRERHALTCQIDQRGRPTMR